MTLVERLSRNGVQQEVATEIHIEIHRHDGGPAWFKALADGSDVTIFRGRRRTVSPDHIHQYVERQTAAGKSKTHISCMIEDVHTMVCGCGQIVSVSYKAPN